MTVTAARIGLGRAGHALPTAAHLDMQLAHARARDAVHRPWDVDRLQTALVEEGITVVRASTRVTGRSEYLRRPDLGRVLSDSSSMSLQGVFEIAVIVSDGLSSEAVERHALPVLSGLVRRFGNRSVSPAVLVPNGRVALLDAVGAAFSAELALILIGERPGLSATDSLAIYLTYAPGPGRTDANRNCLSNIRPPNGLGYGEAVAKAAYLAEQALARGVSGVFLKDESGSSLARQL